MPQRRRRRTTRGAGRLPWRPPGSAAPIPGPGPLPLRDPAALFAALVAAACVTFAVTFRITDSDFWQHLLVGRVIWERHAIPRVHLWSWVTYGQPQVLPSWLFRAALWPFYSMAGTMGLFVWRWSTTLVAFGISWATARRLGGRGLSAWVAIVWCALVYRARSQVRPETMAAVLLALTIWVLEVRRQRARAETLRGGARDPALWLVPVAWIWANAHASYFLAFVLLGVHALDLVARRGRASLGATLRPIAIGALAMLAISFLNPFGWRTLWQPFDYALHLSKEPLFQGIGELQPMSWYTNVRNGAWLMIVAWPVLALLRARREGWDLAELLTLALASAYAIPSQRFLGVYALAAAPYLARDLDAWVRSRPWPAWTARPVARGALVAAACAIMGIPEAGRPTFVPGVGIELSRFPVAACDFMAAHGVRGHGFSDFRSVGYQAWRFWPDRERLPFTDIHQSGSPEDRLAFAAAFVNPTVAWPALVRRYRLDYAVLDRRVGTGAALLEVVDADTGWSMVFLDDTAGLYVRRQSLAAVADSFGYRFLGAGTERMALLARRMAADSTMIDSVRRELERSAAGSRWNARAHSYLASLALVTGRTGQLDSLTNRR